MQWTADRHRYRLACGIRDGAGYADDCKAETEALSELTARGFFGGAHMVNLHFWALLLAVLAVIFTPPGAM